MSKTKIEWCKRPGTLPEVWNVVTGCDKVSQGCKNCYAEIMHGRLQHMMPDKYDHDFLGTVKMHSDLVELPMKWKKRRTVFVNSMSDLFHDQVTFEFIESVFITMDICHWHTFQVLTKRPKRLLAFIEYWTVKYNCDFAKVFKHVWVIVSVENQEAAAERIPLLLKAPIEIKGLSCEPLLGPLDITQWLPYLQWVIVGGESGNKARPMHPDWVTSIRDQCKSFAVPFFFKQWGQWLSSYQFGLQLLEIPFKNKMPDYTSFPDGQRMHKVGKKFSGRSIDGKEYNEFPLNEYFL